MNKGDTYVFTFRFALTKTFWKICRRKNPQHIRKHFKSLSSFLTCYVKSFRIKPIDFFVFRSWEDHRRLGRYTEKIHNIYENAAVSASNLSLHFLYVKSLCIKPIDFFVFRSWEDHRRFGRYAEERIHNIYENTAVSASDLSLSSFLIC